MSLITCPTCSGQPTPTKLPCATCGGTGVINDMADTTSTEGSDRTNDKVHVYQDTDEQWRWKRIAPNGVELSNSGEGYVDKAYTFEIGTAVNIGCAIIDDSDD